MRKPTTIKAEIAENYKLFETKGILADEKAFIASEIADLENELKEALKAEATPKKPAATKKAAPKKKKTTKKKSAVKKKTTTKKTTPAKPKEKKFVMVGDEKVFEDDPKFCEIIIDKWKARKEAIKKAAGTRKTKSVIQRAAADVADAVSKGIRNFKVDEIKKDPKKAIAKMEKLEKAGKEFIDAYKDIIGEKITQKEIKEEFEGLDKAIKQISDKYLKEKQKMAKGGILYEKGKNYPVKKIASSDCEKYGLDEFPNFDKSGSISGMKKKYYGKDALLVKCGNYIYNVTSKPEIYFNNAFFENGGETDNDLTPGSTYTFSDGFAWEIVSKKEAKDIFLDDGVVFGLNINEETEGMIEDEEDFDAYEVFAVEKETMAKGGSVEKEKLGLKYNLHKDGTPVVDGFKNEEELLKAKKELIKNGYKPIRVDFEKFTFSEGGEVNENLVKISIKDIQLIDEGDSAKVFSDKSKRNGEMGVITKIHGLKYTLKFKDGKKEDFHQSQLEFYKQKQKMAKGGQTDSDVIIIPNIKGLKKFVDGITNVNHKDYGKFKGRGNRRLIKNINGVEFSENYPILKVTNRYAYYYDIDSQTDKFLDAPFKVKLKQKMAKGGEVNTAKPLTQIDEEISKLSFKPDSFRVVVTEDAWENTGDPYNLDVYEFDNLEDAYQKFVEELKDIKNMYASENPDYKSVQLEAWDEDDYEMETLDDERYDVSYEDDYGKLVIQYQHVGKGMNYAHKFIGLFFLDEYTEKDLSNNPDKMFSTWTNILDITEEDLSGLTYDEAVEKIKDEANLKLQNNITLDDIIDVIDIIDENEDEQED